MILSGTLAPISAACAMVATVLGLAATGCASSSSAYTASGERTRSPLLAERLCQQGAACMDDDPREAEELFRRALEADLYHGPSHNNLGVLLLAQGRLYDAAGEFEWAKRLLPGHPDPRLNMALTFEIAGRTDEALELYATALEVYPDHLPTVGAVTRLQIKSGRADSQTASRLNDLALRGEDERWREWARGELAKREAPGATRP